MAHFASMALPLPVTALEMEAMPFMPNINIVTMVHVHGCCRPCARMAGCSTVPASMIAQDKAEGRSCCRPQWKRTARMQPRQLHRSHLNALSTKHAEQVHLSPSLPLAPSNLLAKGVLRTLRDLLRHWHFWTPSAVPGAQYPCLPAPDCSFKL